MANYKMSRAVTLLLLVVAAVAAPAVAVALEWLRTIPGYINLAPGISYMPNGFIQFYLIVMTAMFIIALPISLGLIQLGDLRPARYVRNTLMVLIFWKIIDVTMLSDGAHGLDNTASTLVLSLGTFGYGIIIGFVFWRIGVRPHRYGAALRAGGSQTSDM